MNTTTTVTQNVEDKQDTALYRIDQSQHSLRLVLRLSVNLRDPGAAGGPLAAVQELRAVLHYRHRLPTGDTFSSKRRARPAPGGVVACVGGEGQQQDGEAVHDLLAGPGLVHQLLQNQHTCM